MNPFLNGKQIFNKRRSAYIPFNTSIITMYTLIQTEPCKIENTKIVNLNS